MRLLIKPLSVLLCAVVFMILVLVSCTPARVTPPAGPPPAAPVAAESYKFTLGNMSVTPAEAQAGTAIQVTVPVSNAGTASNAYVATLYVDGQEYMTRDLTLAPGQNGSLVFTLTNLVAGNHTITVGNQTGAVKIYTAQTYSIANNQIYMPRYTPLQYTAPPALPYISSDSFSPPATPFYITRIDFRYPFPQSFKILDANNKQLYSADISYNESAYIPNVEVDGDFTVQMQTSQPAADIRSEFFGFSSWELVIAYFWPEVSTVEGFQKRFGP